MSKPVPDEFLRNYLDHRLPSIEKIERIRAAGITAEDEWVETFADTLLDIRHAVRGGMREPKVNNWNALNTDELDEMTGGNPYDH